MSPHAPIEDLVARARAGEDEARRAIFDAHADRVWSYCLGFALGDEALALELCEDTWVAVFGALDHLREPSRIASWLDAVTRINCIRIAEQRRASPGYVPRVPDSLFEQIASCPSRKLQAVASLAYDDEPVPPDRIAERLGIGLEEVHARLVRFDTWARAQLVARLAQDPPEAR